MIRCPFLLGNPGFRELSVIEYRLEMGAIWNWLVGRMSADARVVRDSPMAFVMCLIVGVALASLAIWSLLDFKYSSQINTANNLSAYLARQVDDGQRLLQNYQVIKQSAQINSIEPSTSISDRPSVGNFSTITGCQYLREVPYKITAYHNYSRSEIVMAAINFAAKLKELEIARSQKLIEAASLPEDNSSENIVAKRYTEISRVD